MSKLKLDRWLDVLGQLAVVVGLFVVAVELRQTSTIANGELSAQYLTNWQVIDQTHLDPGFASAYARSIQAPSELTLTERAQLNGYYWAVMDQMDLARELVEAGIFRDSLEELWSSTARGSLTTPYARAWWNWYRDEFADTAQVRIVESALQNLSPDAERQRFEAIDAHLNEILGTPQGN